MAPYRDKDDKYKPAHTIWRPAISGLRFRRNRKTIAWMIGLAFMVYLVYSTLLWSSTLEADENADPWNGESAVHGRHPSDDSAPSAEQKAAKSQPDLNLYKPSRSEGRTYDGPIKFFNLLASLNKINRYRGSGNRHVLFAASSLASANSLAGFACDMANEKINTVHLVLVGRNEEPVQFFETANKIGGENCPIVIHDGRPNSADRSTDARMELSVMSVLIHVKKYINPSVLLVDSVNDDAFFLKAVETRSKTLDLPLIKLPAKPAETLPWLTKLDSGSLAAWQKPSIDIFIYADARSGNFIRLLKSLQNADYFNKDLPRLHIELGPFVDTHIRSFLNGYQWPSREKLFVRHRIGTLNATTSVVEGFYPSHSDNAILILDPDVELSPHYFSWVIFSILHYKHASLGHQDTGMFCGVSLHRPFTFLDGKPFAAEGLENLPFLYSVPSSYAAVYFGDHWRQLHSYLTHRLQTKHTDGVDYSIPTKTSYVPKQAAWHTLFLELATARGYMMLYPPFSNTESTQSLVDAKSPVLKNPMPDTVPPWLTLAYLDVNGQKSTEANLQNIAEGYRKKIANCKWDWKVPPGLSEAEDLFCLARQRIASQDVPVQAAQTEPERAKLPVLPAAGDQPTRPH